MRHGKVFSRVVFAASLLCATTAAAADKAGNMDVRSTQIGARVYLDDEYKGDADLYIEKVSPGEHTVTCRYGSHVVSGTFTLREGETMMLEARFDEQRIVDFKEIARESARKRAEAEKRAESEKNQEPAPVKPEPQKKPQEPKKAADPKKQQQKAAAAEAEQKDQQLNIIKVVFDELGTLDFKVSHRVNQKAVGRYNDNKGLNGRLYRTKKNILLCETGACTREWSATFFYTDEAGKRDAFLLRWKETVFSGMTPSGTSKRELELCVNGECKRIATSTIAEAAQNSEMDRYAVSFSKSWLTIRRADLIKEITDAGGTVPEY